MPKLRLFSNAKAVPLNQDGYVCNSSNQLAPPADLRSSAEAALENAVNVFVIQLDYGLVKVPMGAQLKQMLSGRLVD
jgi:hypothetical protein